MAVTAWKAPQDAQSIVYGTKSWSNPGYAKVDDSNAATCVLAKNEVSYYLALTEFGFTTVDIPAGATINGIEVEFTKKSNLVYVQDSSIRLWKASGGSAQDKASATLWSSTKFTSTYGSSTDNWGGFCSDSDIRTSNFGVRLVAVNIQLGDPDTGYVYFCRIRVYYTAGVTSQPWVVIM